MLILAPALANAAVSKLANPSFINAARLRCVDVQLVAGNTRVAAFIATRNPSVRATAQAAVLELDIRIFLPAAKRGRVLVESVAWNIDRAAEAVGLFASRRAAADAALSKVVKRSPAARPGHAHVVVATWNFSRVAAEKSSIRALLDAAAPELEHGQRIRVATLGCGVVLIAASNTSLAAESVRRNGWGARHTAGIFHGRTGGDGSHEEDQGGGDVHLCWSVGSVRCVVVCGVCGKKRNESLIALLKNEVRWKEVSCRAVEILDQLRGFHTNNTLEARGIIAAAHCQQCASKKGLMGGDQLAEIRPALAFGNTKDTSTTTKRAPRSSWRSRDRVGRPYNPLNREEGLYYPICVHDTLCVA